MDNDFARRKLAELNERSGPRNSVWKPKAGDYTIRIVPYQHNKDWPFIELWFHYNLSSKTVLSPISFGRPDPVKDFGEKLKSTGSKDDYTLGKLLTPACRVYAPILVRGAEAEGVKFWGFSIKVYQQLVETINDPDYGDISDLMQGHDIKVTFEANSGGGFTRGDTKLGVVRVRPKSSPATDIQSVLDSIKAMPKIESYFSEPSVDELREMLREFTENSGEQPATDDSYAASTTKKSNVKDEDDDEDDDDEKLTTATPDVKATFKTFFKNKDGKG